METIPVLLLVLAALALIIWGYAVVDINRRKFSTENERRYWVNLVWFLPLFGALYYLISRNNKRKP